METLEEKTQSEFGKGLTYCLGLFLCHAERFRQDKEIYEKIGSLSDRAAMMWFNAASDHFYELDANRVKDKKLRARINNLKKKALAWGHGDLDTETKEKDVYWAISEAKACLLEIDRLELGVDAIEGEFQ